MPDRDDLIGLLRSLDGALRTVEPALGHEARLRARLAAESGARRPAIAPARRIAQPLALVLCAAAAGGAAWLALSSARAPEPSAQPLVAPPAASEAIGAEPRPEPPASSRSSRPSPWRPAPVLPLLPPHGEIAPTPSNDRAPVPADTAAPARRAQAPVTPRSTPAVPDGRLALSTAARAPRPAAWGATAAASPEARAAAPTNMGTLSGEGRGSASSAPGTRGSTSSSTGATGTKQPVSGPDQAASSCEAEALDFGDKCLDPGDLKEMAFELCDAKGLVLTGLDSAASCGSGGVALAKVTCCPPGPPSPADPYWACKPVSAGDEITCVDPALLEKQLSALCASWSMSSAKVEVAVPCSDGSAAAVEGLCCPPVAPPSDPGPAPAGLVGDGASCTPDDKLEDSASFVCQSLGLSLLDFSAADDCDADTSTVAKYVCGK